MRVWLTGATGRGEPHWSTQPDAPGAACADKTGKPFCFEFDLPYDVDNPKNVQVSATFSDGTPAISLPVLVIDRLVVGLGDSYAAGEGNPDLPAQFAEGKDESDALFKWFVGNKATREPESDDGTRAGWLDRRCHRSMYSYQFKTALHLALSNPHEAITYVTYSCAGATTPQIIDKEEKANEGGGALDPQLEVLRKLLRNGQKPVREIDYLLLSTGGNDILFSKLVAFVVLKEGMLGALKFWGVSEEEIIKHNRAKYFAQVLLGESDCARHKCGNYRLLQKALLTGSSKAPPLRIKECGANQPCKRILLTPYPNVFTNEDGDTCRAERGEFDGTFGRDPTRWHRIEVVRDYVFKQIQDVQQSAVVTGELGWTVVSRNVDAYLNHGFCAQNSGSTSETGEEFELPVLKNKEDVTWSPFKPWQYRAYETRQRWMRLPVDAKLSTNQFHWVFHIFKADLFLEDERSNIMHPTAEGYAATADLNVAAIRQIDPLVP